MSRTAGVAAFLLLLATATAGAQDAVRSKLDELEKKLDAQSEELERLKAQRMADELRAAPDAPPHVERAPEKEAAASADAARSFEWGFDDGFFVKGEVAGSKYVLRPRAYIQLDYRAYVHSQANAAFPTKGVGNDQFVVRRAVIGFVGSFADFGFFFEAEPTRGSNGLLPLLNAWLEWRPLAEAQLRAGHFIPPFTFADGFTSPPFQDFLEHPMMVQALSYSFRPGAMAHGDLEKGALSWFLAINNELDNNNTITGDPIVTARVASHVGAFGFGVAGSWERLGGPTHNSIQGLTPGQFRWFSPVAVRGWSQRYEGDFELDLGPFFASAEYGWAIQQRDRANADGSDSKPLVAQGAYATVGWMFLGPPAASKRPHAPFEGWTFSLDLERRRNARNVGAEVVARVEWFSIDEARGGRDFKGNDAKAVVFGLNVYPMENVKLMIDYVHVHVGDQSRAERAHSREGDELLVRAQLEF